MWVKTTSGSLYNLSRAVCIRAVEAADEPVLCVVWLYYDAARTEGVPLHEKPVKPEIAERLLQRITADLYDQNAYFDTERALEDITGALSEEQAESIHPLREGAHSGSVQKDELSR